VAFLAICSVPGLKPFGCFFLFDFTAELFVFGVLGFAGFVFVVDFFDRDRFFVAFVLAFVVCFLFAVLRSDEGRRSGNRGKHHRVRRSGRGEQQQRGEQEDQQVREFPHGPLIGAIREPV
jgi:hypothetical protein